MEIIGFFTKYHRTSLNFLTEKNLNTLRSHFKYYKKGDTRIKLSYNYKIWLEYNKKPLLGKGRYELLKNINKTNSLKLSALKIGISNKTAYNYIKKIETNLGKKVINSYKGGKDAGGYTKLNSTGLELIEKYEEAISNIE